MEKFKKFIKDMRFEYKVLNIVIIILLLSVPVSIIKKKFFSDIKLQRISGIGGAGVNGTSLRDMQNTQSNKESNKPSSISEAISADRPLILDDTVLQDTDFRQIMIEHPDIKHIEVATKVENPTVWIYSLNDGLRKDDVAARYCSILHNRGIMASNVTIYDEKERKKGRLIELGAAKCM